MKQLSFILTTAFSFFLLTPSMASAQNVLGCQSLLGKWSGTGTIAGVEQNINLNISTIKNVFKGRTAVYTFSGTLNGDPLILDGSGCAEINSPAGPSIESVYIASQNAAGFTYTVDNKAKPSVIIFPSPVISGYNMIGKLSR